MLLFHFNCIEKHLYVGIRVKWLNLHRSLIKMLILDENFRWHFCSWTLRLNKYQFFILEVSAKHLWAKMATSNQIKGMLQ